MEPLTTTPFGQRPVSACLLQTIADTHDRPGPAAIGKWDVFHQLCTAREVFGISHRTLAVLDALLSFHPAAELRQDASLIVFPSNTTLSRRAHGMPESTLRRHLSSLVEAGLILRHDSANGKRFVRRGRAGVPDRAFGLDLRPLLVRAPEIARAAKNAEAEADDRHALREAAVLLLRDAAKMIAHGKADHPGAHWRPLVDRLETLRKTLRRKLALPQLRILIDNLKDLVSRLHHLLMPEPAETGGNDSQNERHHHNPKKESFDTCEERTLHLHTIVAACSEVETCMGRTPSSWPEFIEMGRRLFPMIGIPRHAWQKAVTMMGVGNAATVVACILQRLSSIRSPGAYLSSLAKKAEQGVFSPAPMVMALLRGQES